MKSRRKAGLTLVELMLVVLIISLLAAVVVPSFTRARRRTRVTVCINNLRMMDGAKDYYAMENRLHDGDAVGDLGPYLKGGVVPACPAGGDYTVGVIGVPPACTVEGHELP